MRKVFFFVLFVVCANLSHRLYSLWANAWIGKRVYDELRLWIRRYVYVVNYF
jgi:hypothetical protein